MHNYLWIKMKIIMKGNSITIQQSGSYTILVGKIVFSLLLIFLCLVMDVVCLSILNLWSRFKGVSSITRSILGFFWGWYWRKMYKGKIGVRLGRLSRNIYLGMYQKEYNTEICFYIEAKDYNSKIKNSAKIQIWGNMFYFYSRHWK